jgi:hypothetical protein
MPGKQIGRREFVRVGGQTLGALSAAGAVGAYAAESQAPAVPANLRVRGKQVLGKADFRYLGFYDIDLGGEFSYGQGLTHRYVNGQLRFLALTHGPSGMKYRLREFTPPSAFGGRVSGTSITGDWTDPWGGIFGNADGRHFGIWWDDQTNRLWTNSAIDYPNDDHASRTGTFTATALGVSGVVESVQGLYGLEGIGTRRHYGGMLRLPLWFRNMYGVGEYASGFGGYSSRMMQGLSVSMGPALYAFDNPLALPAGTTTFPTNAFKVLADHSAGNRSDDWYYNSGAKSPSSFDRGVRIADYENFYSQPGLPNNSPVPPGVTAEIWQQAPDGHGRWIWADSAYQTGVWLDLPTKYAFLLIPTVHTGRNWYQNSTLNWEGKTAEFQVFDPTHLGEVALKKRQPWNVKPVEVWRPDWQVNLRKNGQGNSANHTACAATFDTTTNRLYVRWTFAGGSWPHTRDRLLVWEVG